MIKSKKNRISTFIYHSILIIWVIIVLFPIWTMLVNSVKPQLEIFSSPFGIPSEPTLKGFIDVFNDSSFIKYLRNSFFITSLSLIVILFLGSIASYAIANWKSKITSILYIFFIAGLMVPIRLGTINIFQIIRSLGLINTVFSLFPVYVAMGMPIAVFVFTTFINETPDDIFNASRIDGASEFQIYLYIMLPILRPAMATVAIFNLVPIWNDLWFPLIFIRAENHRTLILGVSLLFGQYQTNWTNILSILTLSALPILILYIILSKQFIKGLTAGALKG